MGVASGCGCKAVYRFPHTTYPYSSCICSFLQQHLYFLFIFLMFFVLVLYSMVQEREIEGMYALLMITNKHEAVSYRFPTFSLLLEPHGGLVHVSILFL